MKSKYCIPFILLIALTDCQWSCNRYTPMPQNTFVHDSLWTPTGNTQIDSLLQLITVVPRDTTLAFLYYKVGEEYGNTDYEKAKEYYLNLEALSNQLNWKRGRYLSVTSFATILIREYLCDSALVMLQNAYDLAIHESDESWAVHIVFKMGDAYFIKEWYDAALSCYMQALSFYEKKNDSKKIHHIYYMITQLYTSLNAAEKGIEYGEKAVSLNREESALFALAKAYSLDGQYEKANNCYEEALRFATLHNDSYMITLIYPHFANSLLMLFDLENAEKFTLLSLEIKQTFGHDACVSEFLMLSKLEELKGNYKKSEEYAQEALQIGIRYDSPQIKKVCYAILSELAIIQHKNREYVRHWDKMFLEENAIAYETSLRASEEMAAKYETQKKELRITVLEKEKRLIRLMSLLGGLILLLILATFFFLWRLTVQKRHIVEQQHELAQTRIKQLEQEKQLVATQSVLDGETKERTRLARDLHDGLGSMLTGAKLRFIEMKNGAKLDYADLERFDQALVLLDSSVQEMRRVAHHLMPDALSRFGLKSAVSDFCKNLPLVEFLFYGDESRLEPKLETMIYRCIYELVNNALKHSSASHIVVQIIQESNRIAFTVQDDGCGFDTSATTEGSGLQNIRTRAAAYNSIVNIDSSAEEGTEINIEIKI